MTQRHVRSIICAGCLFTLICQSAHAIVTGLEFSGNITFLSSTPPYGLPISMDAQVSGRFLYSTEAEGTPFGGACDCLGYRQHLANGFAAVIDGVSVSADDYEVRITNSTPGTGSDFLTLIFASNLDPSLPSSLNVNGERRTTGLLRIDLAASAELFDDAKLPERVRPSDFPGVNQGFFSNRPSPIRSGFSINSLLTLPSVPGDYDLDGTVNGADFLMWQRSLGSTGPMADGNFDQLVTSEDLLIWQENLGLSSDLEATAVPESSPLSMAFFMAGLLHRKAAPRRVNS